MHQLENHIRSYLNGKVFCDDDAADVAAATAAVAFITGTF